MTFAQFDLYLTRALLAIPVAAYAGYHAAVLINKLAKPRNRKVGSRFMIGDFQQILE